MKISIFYSWQSDLPGKTNRYFIEDSIKKAIKQINKDQRIIACLDRDTKDELGSPDIRTSIFEKINHSKFFVCDVSLNNTGAPNPNVLLELGYAVKSLGWSKIICLFNEKTGNIEDLPFDINHNRVTPYNPDLHGMKNRIAEIITVNINSLFRNGELYNPIEDHLKKKVDYVVFQIIRNLINIFYFEKEVNYSKRLVELDALTNDEMAQALITHSTLGFYYLFDYSEFQEQLEKLLDQLLSCGYFTDGWRESVINFIDWIDIWDHTIDPHFAPNLFESISDSNYVIKNMHHENPQNPPNSVLLLKRLSGNQYVVVQGGSLSRLKYTDKLVYIQAQYGQIIATRIKEFLRYVDFWMEQTGSEFLLDPHYYVIH